MSIGLQVGRDERILVVAPHQDDECIGCGGALLKWRADGATTGVLWISKTTTGQRLGDEARSAADALGVEWTRALGAPSVGLVADPTWLDPIVAAFRAFGPSVVLLPHAAEDDRQHRVTTELGKEAVWLAEYPSRPDLGEPVPRARVVLAYEVWTPMSEPAMFCDITAHAAGKEKAIASYASQIEIADFCAGALGLNRYRGVTSGAGTFAEAFAVVRLGEGGRT
ncbi:MAG: PIG-L family deacetylase [Actinomycetota bacterium]|nr:PIG-L family deacetylase [Actinomycetota bacterium]